MTCLILNIFFVLFFTSIKCDEGADELTKETFDDYVKNHERILIMFYAPWCGHCNSMKPDYNEAAGILKELEKPAFLAMVDATIATDLASEYGVKGYPTLVYFLDGEHFPYEGGRTKDDLVAYMSDPPPGVKPVSETHVKVATADNFQDIIDNNSYVIVCFYAPWCGHCKQFLPILDTASNRVHHNGDNIVLVKVDATEETTLATTYNIEGYPTIKQFRQGKLSDFDGPRDSTDAFYEYIRTHSGIASTLLESYDHLPSKLSVNEVTVVGLFESQASLAFTNYLEQTAGLRDYYTFYHTFGETTDSFYKHYPETKSDTVSILVIAPKRFGSAYEKEYFIYTADETDTLEKYLDKVSVPLVGELTNESLKHKYKETRPLLMVFTTVDWHGVLKKETQYWRNQIVETAKNFKKLINFVMVDDTTMSSHAVKFGLSDSPSEFNVAILTKDEVKYVLNEELDEWNGEVVSEFIESFLDGKLEPYYRSEMVKKSKGPVKNVVGSNFKKLVVDSKNYVILKAYAPWCGHCKTLAPIYEKLAKDLKSKELLFAQIDTTVNDIPVNFKSDGYPTIFLKKKGQTDPVKYTGDREYEAIRAFIESHMN